MGALQRAKAFLQRAKAMSKGTIELQQGMKDLTQGTKDLTQGTEAMPQATEAMPQDTKELTQDTKDLQQCKKELVNEDRKRQRPIPQLRRSRCTKALLDEEREPLCLIPQLRRSRYTKVLVNKDRERQRRIQQLRPLRCTKSLVNEDRERQRRIQRLRPSSMGTYTLPPELTLMVVEHLDTLSAMCLSLTCRRLNQLCFPRRTYLRPAETTKLLLWLEKDMGTVYFCHGCVKLHPWNEKMFGLRYPYSRRILGRCKGDWDEVDMNGRRLPYAMLRVIMNRHLYGPSHGPSLAVLQRDVVNRKCVWGCVTRQYQDARIIENSLMIATVTVHYHPLGNTKILRGYLDIFAEGICRHLNVKNRCIYANIRIPEMPTEDAPSDFLAPCKPVLRSCPWCMTDYCIEITYEGKPKGYVVKISVCREIGDCRNPDDWSWRNVSGLSFNMREDHPLGYGPGCVSRKWHTVDGISVPSAGEWVSIPGLAEWKEREWREGW